MKISPQLIIDIYVNTQWGEIIFEGGFIIFWKGVSDLETRLNYSYLHAKGVKRSIFQTFWKAYTVFPRIVSVFEFGLMYCDLW